MIVFGSASDKDTYLPLVDSVKKAGLSYEFKVLSAHKTPRELRQAVADTNASIFIAGAGLAAALPGVVAAEQLRPVIGLPCEAAFSGLDSFLSSSQMPPDIPVIAVGVGKAARAVDLCIDYLHGMNEIVLVKKDSGLEKKYFEKCKSFMEENKIPFAIGVASKKTDHSKVYIEFTELGKKFKENQNTIIRVLVKEKTDKKDSLKFFDQLQDSYSVALNSYKNAAIAALQLMNVRGRQNDLLSTIRRKAAQKVLDSND